MENYENKELLKEAAKQSLESLKDLKPGTEEYTNTAKMALQLYDMQLKSDEQESNQNLKEDEELRKGQEVINDQEKAAKARRIEWAKFGIPFYGGNRMRLRMHYSSYFGGCIMLENKFKTGLIRELKERFPGCMVVHLDPNEIQGIPDLLVLYGTTWGALEGKKSASASHRPNQDYYVQQMDEMC